MKYVPGRVMKDPSLSTLASEVLHELAGQRVLQYIASEIEIHLLNIVDKVSTKQFVHKTQNFCD